MKGLNGKLTVNGLFISKSIERTMPLFQTLKGCINKNNFRCAEEVEKELGKLKKALHTLPTLSISISGETLSVYLSTSPEPSMLSSWWNKKENNYQYTLSADAYKAPS